MLKINDQQFEDQTILPPSPEFPLGFGKRMLKSDRAVDVDEFILSNISRIIEATKTWGALIIPQAKIEVEDISEINTEFDFSSEKRRRWQPVSNDDIQWSWHSDLDMRAITLIQLEHLPVRDIPTAIAPLSVIDQAIQTHAKKYLDTGKGKDHNAKAFLSIIKELSKDCSPYVEGNRVNLLDSHFWPRSRRLDDIFGRLRRFANDMNRSLRRNGNVLIHDWAQSPGSAIVFHTDSKDRLHNLATAVHCGLEEDPSKEPQGTIYKNVI